MSVESLLRRIEQYEETPAGFAHELRLSFGELVIRRLRELGWTQRELARKLKRKESQVSRLLGGDHNWTTDSAGEVLCALGVMARIQAVPTHGSTIVLRIHRADGTWDSVKKMDASNGETQYKSQESTRIRADFGEGGRNADTSFCFATALG